MCNNNDNCSLFCSYFFRNKKYELNFRDFRGKINLNEICGFSFCLIQSTNWAEDWRSFVSYIRALVTVCHPLSRLRCSWNHCPATFFIYFNCKYVFTQWQRYYNQTQHTNKIHHTKWHTTLKQNTAHKTTYTMNTMQRQLQLLLVDMFFILLAQYLEPWPEITVFTCICFCANSCRLLLWQNDVISGDDVPLGSSSDFAGSWRMDQPPHGELLRGLCSHLVY
jgi:hypothetical protein